MVSLLRCFRRSFLSSQTLCLSEMLLKLLPIGNHSCSLSIQPASCSPAWAPWLLASGFVFQFWADWRLENSAWNAVCWRCCCSEPAFASCWIFRSVSALHLRCISDSPAETCVAGCCCFQCCLSFAFARCPGNAVQRRSSIVCFGWLGLQGCWRSVLTRLVPWSCFIIWSGPFFPETFLVCGRTDGFDCSHSFTDSLVSFLWKIGHRPSGPVGHQSLWIAAGCWAFACGYQVLLIWFYSCSSTFSWLTILDQKFRSNCWNCYSRWLSYLPDCNWAIVWPYLEYPASSEIDFELPAPSCSTQLWSSAPDTQTAAHDCSSSSFLQEFDQYSAPSSASHLKEND